MNVHYAARGDMRVLDQLMTVDGAANLSIRQIMVLVSMLRRAPAPTRPADLMAEFDIPAWTISRVLRKCLSDGLIMGRAMPDGYLLSALGQRHAEAIVAAFKGVAS